jgi:multicomponent Na+:H+ antiporter subunit A
VKRLVVVDVSSRVIFHTVLVGSIYLLFVGHNQPGGGFVGGLVAGAAIALRFVAGGISDVRGLTRFRPWTILGSGLLVAGLTAITPIVLGDPVLSSAAWSYDAPLFGRIKTTSALVFDTGVYLAVVGLVFMIFEAFGDEPATADTGDPGDTGDPVDAAAGVEVSG